MCERHPGATVVRNGTERSGAQRWRCGACVVEAVRRYRATPAGKEMERENGRRMHAANPVRSAARRRLKRAIASGLIERGPCMVCGLKPYAPLPDGSRPRRARVEAHHAWGYGEWDRVLWLCRDPRHGHPKADRDEAYNEELKRRAQ